MRSGHHLSPSPPLPSAHSPFLLPNALSPASSTGPLPPRRPPRRVGSLRRDYDTPQTASTAAQTTSHMDTLTPGVLGMYDHALDATFADARHANESATSLASRSKAEEFLAPRLSSANLATFYLVSGMPRDTEKWALADMDAIQGLQPMNDSLGLWWRPDTLGSAFSGQTVDDFMRATQRLWKDTRSGALYNARGPPDAVLADMQPNGVAKLVVQTMKYAHPRDIEVINSTLAPQSFCHTFTFTLPRNNSLDNATPSKIDLASAGMVSNSPVAAAQPRSDAFSPMDSIIPYEDETIARDLADNSAITYHGVTLTVWTHADKTRARILKRVQGRIDYTRPTPDAMFEAAVTAATEQTPKPRHRNTINKDSGPAYSQGNPSETDLSEGNGVTDSEAEAPLGRKLWQKAHLRRTGPAVEDVPEDGPAVAVFGDGGDVYWMPYAITLVSRHPIYDFMQDYLKLSWARYQKNVKHHMTQICNLLNYPAPRPGKLYHLPLTIGKDEPILIESTMPGAVDFDKGLIKVDHQIWPLFQVLDVDSILTCAEVALSSSGRVMLCSRFPFLVGIAVNALKYIVDLKGWNGITIAINHAGVQRDMTFVIEDPGPYIVGVLTECRYMVAIPADVVVVDLDSNSVTCKAPPDGLVTPKTKRDKMKLKVIAAFGPHYPVERSVPLEFKMAYPRGCFRNLNRVLGRSRPSFLGERLKPPTWWQHTEIMSAIEKVLENQHKRPSLLRRITGIGPFKSHVSPLTAGEQHAKRMMRLRALHYVESRDKLELKIGQVNQRLLRLMKEGEHWKAQFVVFERHAEKLAKEAQTLKEKIERERREAKRMSNLAHEQLKSNSDLENKLKATELAQAAAMLKLSDMQETMQDLEREREEIMDMLESRVDGILGLTERHDIEEHPDVDLGPKPTTCKPLQRLRPGTSNSVQTSASHMTPASEGISVLGAAGRPRTAGASTVAGRSDVVYARIANIQQKLDIALGVHRANSLENHIVNSNRVTQMGGLATLDEAVEAPATSELHEPDLEPGSAVIVTPASGRKETAAEQAITPEPHIASSVEYRIRPISPLPAPSVSIRARPRRYASDELVTPPKDHDKDTVSRSVLSSSYNEGSVQFRGPSNRLEELEEMDANFEVLRTTEVGHLGLEDEAL